MRIIFGIANFSYGYGIPNVVRTIAEKIMNQGNEVIVLAGKSNINNQVQVIECGYNEILKHANINNSIRKILELKPDIFHSHYYPMDFCGAVTSSQIKHIMHAHGILRREYWSNMKATLECIRSSFSEALGVKHSDKIIAISRYIKSDLIRKYNIKPEKIEVIYPPIDLSCYSSEKRSTLPRIFPDDGINLLSIGAISKRKGQHLLVDAMKEVTREEERVRLYLFGRIGQEDLSYVNEIQDKIKKYGLEKNVFIKGFLETYLIPLAYAQADIFVTGTMWEGFGMPIAEAMSSGNPVVAFDIAALNELINDGVTGFKVQPFDAKLFAKKIIELIQDSKLRKRLGCNGRIYAEKTFDVHNTLSDLLEIYSLIG